MRPEHYIDLTAIFAAASIAAYWIYSAYHLAP
jgi:hypothetical protein